MQQDATLQDLLNKYADGVPVYITTSCLLIMGAVVVVSVALGALAVNAIKKI